MKRNSRRKHSAKKGNGKRLMNQSRQVTVNRTYKNTVFQMIFHQKKELLELQVLVLNINRGNNEELKEKCKALREYMLYIERIRYYTDIEKKSL